MTDETGEEAVTETQSWTAREVRTQHVQHYQVEAHGIAGTPHLSQRNDRTTFRPDYAVVAYSRAGGGPWSLDEIEVVGYRPRPDGTVGRATARRYFYAGDARPAWLDELIDMHRPPA